MALPDLSEALRLGSVNLPGWEPAVEDRGGRQGGCRGFLNRTNTRSQPSSLGSPKACLIVSLQSGTKTKFTLVQSISFHLDQKALACVWTDESGRGGQLGQAVQTNQKCC